ncbi:hypothetical protein DENSPDRAFT_887143 [Dentipellis sp. KUC8613]|nr:hypothetical protein DENSPDRAFT_887143 [Dentipellis sp. KUC8613]
MLPRTLATPAHAIFESHGAASTSRPAVLRPAPPSARPAAPSQCPTQPSVYPSFLAPRRHAPSRVITCPRTAASHPHRRHTPCAAIAHPSRRRQVTPRVAVKRPLVPPPSRHVPPCHRHARLAPPSPPHSSAPPSYGLAAPFCGR